MQNFFFRFRNHKSRDNGLAHAPMHKLFRKLYPFDGEEKSRLRSQEKG